MVKKISQNEFNEVTASEVAVIDFSATWCGPCKMLAPVLEEVSEEYAGKVNFFNVDVDENPDLAMLFEPNGELQISEARFQHNFDALVFPTDGT